MKESRESVSGHELRAVETPWMLDAKQTRSPRGQYAFRPDIAPPADGVFVGVVVDGEDLMMAAYIVFHRCGRTAPGEAMASFIVATPGAKITTEFHLPHDS